MVHMGAFNAVDLYKIPAGQIRLKITFPAHRYLKFLFGQDRTMKEIEHYTYENILDIIAIGFNPKKTKIIVNTKHIQYLYPIAIEVAKRITFSTARAVFGFQFQQYRDDRFSTHTVCTLLPSIIEGKNALY